MGVRITTLIENTIGEHKSLNTEHGLSFLIEKDDVSLLFDTGSSDKYIKNAERLHIDLNRVSHVILSHGHYDHTGGLKPFADFRKHSDFTLWTGTGFFNEKYGQYGPSFQFLGNDFNRSFLDNASIDYREVSSDKTEVVPGVWIVTNFKKTHPEETIHPRFVLWDSAEKCAYPDDFRDEVLVVVESEKGLIVIVGCSHPGILNMLDTVRRLFNEPIYALLGGTHLVEAPDPQLKLIIDAVLKMKISIIGVSHCTGEKAASVIEEKASGSFRNCTGSALIVE